MIATAWLARSALDRMIAEANRSFPTETGGVLIGYWVKLGKEVVIATCTLPGPNAQHTSIAYVPDSDFDEREIAGRYIASGRLETYLGDWHTHPTERPYLSRHDRQTLQRISYEANARAHTPLMAVLGGEPECWTLQVWCYRRHGAWKVSDLSVKVFDEY